MRYHFAETVGPVGARVAQCDPFRGERDATTYGPDEFFAVAGSLGAAPCLVTPWVDGSAEESAAMVAYANFPLGGSRGDVPLGTDVHGRDFRTARHWARLRAEHGHPDPYGVPLVEIGNEPYLGMPVGPTTSCGRPSQFVQSERWIRGVRVPTTARDYAAEVVRTSELLRAVDPDLRIGVATHSPLLGTGDEGAIGAADRELGTDDPWNARLVSDAGGRFDFFAVHPYDFRFGPERLGLARHAEAIARGLLALVPDGPWRPDVAFTEFGFFLGGDTWANALVTFDMIRTSANLGALACVRHILVEDDEGGPFANAAAILGPTKRTTPAFDVLARLAVAKGAVHVDVDGGPLAALAWRRGDRHFGLAVGDLRPVPGPVRVTARIPAGRYTRTTTTFAATHLDAPHVDETTERRDDEPLDALTFDVPANGLVLVTLERTD